QRAVLPQRRCRRDLDPSGRSAGRRHDARDQSVQRPRRRRTRRPDSRGDGRAHTMKRLLTTAAAAFTLIEVMIAIAFIGIALVALLGLHHTDMQSVIRGQDLTRAAMLAQALMSQAELERFPEPGQKRGDFSQSYPGMFPNFRWQRVVDQSTLFPTVERVRVSVTYGPGGRRH